MALAIRVVAVAMALAATEAGVVGRAGGGAGRRLKLASDCASDEVYISELSVCVKNPNKQKRESQASLPALSSVKKTAEDVSLETADVSSPSQSEEDCGSNEVWLSELSLCMEVNEIIPPGLQSASLVKDQALVAKDRRSAVNKSLEVAKPSTKSVCGANEIYVSEIGLCQPANPGKPKRPLSSASLVKEPVSSVVDAGPVFEPKGCRPGEIHVSELNICLPSDSSKARPPPPPSASLVKEPETLELVSFAESSTASDCAPGEFFIAELGICA